MSALASPQSARLTDPTLRSFAAFVADDAIATVRQAVHQIGMRSARVVAGGVAEAIRELASMRTPEQVLIDISGADNALSAVVSLAEVCDPGTQVVALGDVNDVDLYRDLLRHGLHDYLVKPVTSELLVATLQSGGRSASAGTDQGKLIAVVGTRGGVGATAVATNLAWALAYEHQQRVALVDLDLFFGSCALAFDVELGQGFREAMENPARIDSLFAERSMVREGENLYVLSTEEALEAPFAFDAAAIDILLTHLLRDFQCVVVDFPRFALRRQVRVLQQSASAVLVSDGSLAGMRDTRRLNALIKGAVPEAGVMLILNRDGGSRPSELKPADFERNVEIKIDLRIPDDVRAFAASAAAGQPVLKVAPRSRAAVALRGLAARFGGSRVRPARFLALRRRLAGVC